MYIPGKGLGFPAGLAGLIFIEIHGRLGEDLTIGGNHMPKVGFISLPPKTLALWI
jgi:hypothetical protein